MKQLKQKRKGYAITLEVIFTVMIISAMFNSTAYILTTLNTQRYMNTILTSTTIQVAKWGGTSSKAYEANGMKYDPIQNAQKELDRTASMFKPKISGEPKKVTTGNTKVSVSLRWRYPGLFFIDPIDKTLTLKMESIMRPGDLL